MKPTRHRGIWDEAAKPARRTDQSGCPHRQRRLWREAFVMTKVCTDGRDKNLGMRMLEESLRRLQTDRLDLWQVHEVVYENDPDLIFVPNGVAEALLTAKQQGKIRFVGFTGHKDPRFISKCSLTIFLLILGRCR
jgi:aryl-alcohol dehydrogenase-like predicted oxidoreductase